VSNSFITPGIIPPLTAVSGAGVSALVGPIKDIWGKPVDFTLWDNYGFSGSLGVDPSVAWPYGGGIPFISSISVGFADGTMEIFLDWSDLKVLNPGVLYQIGLSGVQGASDSYSTIATGSVLVLF